MKPWEELTYNERKEWAAKLNYRYHLTGRWMKTVERLYKKKLKEERAK